MEENKEIYVVRKYKAIYVTAVFINLRFFEDLNIFPLNCQQYLAGQRSTLI